ncbi:hypothetical protein Sp14A_09250 [Streptococcus pluranimalium]|uniref:DNA methylase N-4/N-6 domain-containing protein n=1 Tax=Streptococcus pluranimalium TaxID=82348 RepID=A0A345VJE4_9STRE|nr:hypothetical protein [Streptococcus pluranimalium]AXJ12846.1 hypothetical protein Sp14A_09250 [Streptococcus pluranimalium]
MCGDATNLDHLERLLDGVEADLYLTDPPYNVAYQKTSEALIIQNNQMRATAFQEFLTAAFQAVDTYNTYKVF